MLDTATDLTGRLAKTLDALEVGQVTMRHAVALRDSVRPLDDERAQKVEDLVLPRDEKPEPGITRPVPTMSAFRQRVHRAKLRVDPRGQQQRHDDALARRRVAAYPNDDGMMTLSAYLPAQGALTVNTALDVLARAQRAPGDSRNRDQRRADALVQIAANTLHHGDAAVCHANRDNDPTGQAATCHTDGDSESTVSSSGSQDPRWHGMRPAVNVTVALSTLLGLDEQPGELDGYAAIPAQVARRIAADESGTWRRLVTDELGHLVDFGRSAYRPPPDLARFVIARDRTCRAPGCNRQAVHSDLHHLTPWSRGGETNAKDLIPACERNHYGLHDGGWSCHRNGDSSLNWTSPTGHTYRVHPADYPVDHTTDTNTEAEPPDEDEPPY